MEPVSMKCAYCGDELLCDSDADKARQAYESGWSRHNIRAAAGPVQAVDVCYSCLFRSLVVGDCLAPDSFSDAEAAAFEDFKRIIGKMRDRGDGCGSVRTGACSGGSCCDAKTVDVTANGGDYTEVAVPDCPGQTHLPGMAPAPDYGRTKYRRVVRDVDATGQVKGFAIVDVYEVLEAFGVVCPARAHAIKKLLAAGSRDKGDAVQDLQEAVVAVERAIRLEQNRCEHVAVNKRLFAGTAASRSSTGDK